MIQKTPKKIKGARKKRRAAEKQAQKKAIEDLWEYKSNYFNAKILSILHQHFNT